MRSRVECHQHSSGRKSHASECTAILKLLEIIGFDSCLLIGSWNIAAFAAKGKWCLETFANKPIFLNGLRLGFRGFEAKIFVEHVQKHSLNVII